MGIPPHAARLAGAWAVRSTATGGPSATDTPSERTSTVDAVLPTQGSRGQGRRAGRDRSHRITVSRILHPLHRHA